MYSSRYPSCSRNAKALSNKVRTCCSFVRASTSSDLRANLAKSGDFPFRASSRMTLDEKSLEIAASCSDAGLIIPASSRTTFHLDTIDFTPPYPFWQEQMDPPFPRFKTPNAENQ